MFAIKVAFFAVWFLLSTASCKGSMRRYGDCLNRISNVTDRIVAQSAHKNFVAENVKIRRGYTIAGLFEAFNVLSSLVSSAFVFYILFL